MAFEYIASPYTHEDENIVQQRFEEVEEYVACALLKGRHVYSPIVHCHEVAKKYNLPIDFDFWEAYNFAMLEKADVLVVLTIPGWRKSKGVKNEIKFAKKHNIPIVYHATS